MWGSSMWAFDFTLMTELHDGPMQQDMGQGSCHIPQCFNLLFLIQSEVLPVHSKNNFPVSEKPILPLGNREGNPAHPSAHSHNEKPF